VQCRENDIRVIELLEKIDDAPSRMAVEAEREALREADAGCEVAFGAHCIKLGRQFQLTCMLERHDQVHSVRHFKTGTENLGADAWHELERKFSES